MEIQILAAPLEMNKALKNVKSLLYCYCTHRYPTVTLSLKYLYSPLSPVTIALPVYYLSPVSHLTEICIASYFLGAV